MRFSPVAGLKLSAEVRAMTAPEKYRPGEGGARNDQRKEPAHAGGEPSTAVWFKLYPARWAALAMREPDNAKLGERARRIILALCEQKQSADPFADEVMASTAAAMQAASEHARKAAIASWEKRRKGKPPEQCPSIGRGERFMPEQCKEKRFRR